MCNLMMDEWKYEIIQPKNEKRPVLKNINNTFIINNSDTEFSSSCCVGKCRLEKEHKYINISVECKEEFKKGKVIIAVFQYKDNTRLYGDYLIKKNNKYEIDLKIMDGVNNISIEYLFYSYGEGKVEISFPVIKRIEKINKRNLNVATAYFDRTFSNDINSNLKIISDIIDKAAAANPKPDILCFTETVYDRGLTVSFQDKFITQDSDVIEFIEKKAKDSGMYIVFGFHEKEKDNLYNTVVIISDKGEIEAKYRKTHLCYDEIKGGMIPGNDLPVFDLPIGKVGILICWDQWFPESARELVNNGAEIIFIATAGFPKCLTQARAKENGVYVVAAGAESKESSFICDKNGEIIAQTDSENQIAFGTVDLNSHEYTRWLSFENGYGADLYKCDIRKDIYTYNKN